MLKLFLQPFKALPSPIPDSFFDQTVLITGANTGLGREAARHALNLGAGKVILGVRSVAKGEEARTDIESMTTTTGGKRGVVEVWPLDLESFESVKKFASRARTHVEGGGRLDVAIMNAGLASGEWNVTADGWERQLQVNVLSTALLSLLILRIQVEGRNNLPHVVRPHLVIVASDIHVSAKFPEKHADSILSSLNDEKKWKQAQDAGGPAERYSVSKLMDIYMVVEMANAVPRIDGEPAVIVNAVTPGFCKSELLTREKAPLILKVVQALTGRSTEEGSKALIHAASSTSETHGKWLENGRVAEYMHPHILSDRYSMDD